MSDVTLAILAGGKGVRMGTPKSNLTFSGKPILVYLHERFAWAGKTMLVSGIGNEHPAGWECFDREVTDAVADQGPLRGVLTALQNCTTDLLALVTVDMPAITREMLEYLIEQVKADAQALGAMYQRPIDGAFRIEPFPCILQRSLANAVARRIEQGKRSVYGLCEDRVKTVQAREEWGEGVWRNLNTPADLD